jgi:hypothetical protein
MHKSKQQATPTFLHDIHEIKLTGLIKFQAGTSASHPGHDPLRECPIQVTAFRLKIKKKKRWKVYFVAHIASSARKGKFNRSRVSTISRGCVFLRLTSLMEQGKGKVKLLSLCFN